LIVTGRDREQALARSRRALDEFVVEGMPTVIPFHRKVVDDPAYTATGGSFGVHTRWIETEFVNDIEPYAESAEPVEAEGRETVTVEVGGKRLEVVLPAGLGAVASSTDDKPVKRGPTKKSAGAASGDALTSPMQGTIVKIAVKDGQHVEAGELVIVLEAMKMEQPLNAHKAGTVTGLSAEVGSTVTNGAVLCEIKV
jgi:acetyl-CoA/propionyl-CoA carboxylase, biotin carboxylase, biotin carboxyl carrier protein